MQRKLIYGQCFNFIAVKN